MALDKAVAAAESVHLHRALQVSGWMVGLVIQGVIFISASRHIFLFCCLLFYDY